MITGSSVAGILQPQLAQDIQPAQARHQDVEQHEVERPLPHQLDRPAPVLRDRDREPLPLQPAREHVAVRLVIVHDEQRAR